MIEKREWKRVPLDFSAQCRLADKAKYHHVQLTDMHHQGFRFNSPMEFQKGQEVCMVVDHAVLGRLYLVGEIKWVKCIDGDKPYRVGVRLLGNDPVFVENSLKLYCYLMDR